MTALTKPSPADVVSASEVLSSVVVQTCVLRNETLDRLVGAQVYVKCENLQRTGAFKYRGAYNCLSRFDRSEFPGGAVAYSTGNHGVAVAAVGSILGIPTTIVMPTDAPAVKVGKVQRCGARIVFYDRNLESREEIAARIAAEASTVTIPPGDNPFVIAGQGTVALEALGQLGADRPDIVLVPCGGGGLAAGTVLAVEAANSTAEVWAVEPEYFDDTRRSLESGYRTVNAQKSGSICDALLAPTPAELPFSINRKRLSRVLTASDEDVLRAIRFAFDELKLVTEPGGVIALASLLRNPIVFAGRKVLVVISGGNVDPGIFKKALSLDRV